MKIKTNFSPSHLPKKRKKFLQTAVRNLAFCAILGLILEQWAMRALPRANMM